MLFQFGYFLKLLMMLTTRISYRHETKQLKQCCIHQGPVTVEHQLSRPHLSRHMCGSKFTFLSTVIDLSGNSVIQTVGWGIEMYG